MHWEIKNVHKKQLIAEKLQIALLKRLNVSSQIKLSNWLILALKIN